MKKHLITTYIIMFSIVTLVNAQEDPAVKKNLNIIKNPAETSSMKIAAVKALVKTKTKEVIPVFKDIIVDKKADPKLRIIAAESLLEFEKDGIDALVESAEDVFKNALLPTVKDGSLRWNNFEETEEPFIKALMPVIGKTKDYRILFYLYIPITVKNTRLLCPEVLGQPGFRDAIPFLFSLTDSNEVKMRKAAMVALAKVKEPIVVPGMIEVLTTEKNAGVRIAAAKTLGELGSIYFSNLKNGQYSDEERKKVLDNISKSIQTLEELRAKSFLDDEKKALDTVLKALKEKK